MATKGSPGETSDEFGADTPEPASKPTIDVARAPRGEVTALALVEAVAALDDRVEHHYLEVKGPLDLGTKKDQAKLVKFILGAANRMPDIATTAFEGFGVMVIGVSASAMVGVPPVEVLEIDKAVRPTSARTGHVGICCVFRRPGQE